MNATIEDRQGVTHGLRWDETRECWTIVPIASEEPQRGAVRPLSPEAGYQQPEPEPPADALTAPQMRVIGLCGAAGAGKDTVAGFLLDAVAGAKRQGWADMLKLSAARVFYPSMGLEQALHFCNWLKQPGNEVHAGCAGGVPVATPTGREFLQRYGTEAHRDLFGQDFWLDQVLPEGRDDCTLLLIPDTRFENEAERIHERGGEVWKIVRPDQTAVEAHASEAGIDGRLVDREILNYSDLDELRYQTQLAWEAFAR